MTSQAERTSPGPAQPPQVSDDRDAFAEMFDAHARHIFDYCYSLLGDRARAASATQVTLIAAHSLAGRLKDPGRMRAFVLALARWECLSGVQGLSGAAEPDTIGPPGTEELAASLAFVDQADNIGEPATGELTLSDFEASSGLSLRAALKALPREDREILDLLYRHKVGMADLALLLGVPAASVPGMLTAAEAKFSVQASETADPAAVGLASPDVRAEQLSAVRLVSLPASVWRRTARVVMDRRFESYREAVSTHAEHLDPDGFPVQPGPIPSSRKLLMASALMAGLLLAPAAAGGAVYAAVSTLAHVVDHHHITAVAPDGPSGSAGGTSGAGRAHSAGGVKRAAGSKPQGDPGASAPPGLLPRAHHRPSPSAVPTSRYSSPTSPSPSPSHTSPGSPSPSPSPTSTSPGSPSPSSTPTTGTTAAAAATPTDGA